MEVNFFVDTNGDGSPDLEVIYYGSGRGDTPSPMASVIYGRSLPTVSRPAPGFTNDQNNWYTVSISQVYTTGVVVGVAFTAYSSSGTAKIWWDNVDFQRCALPSYIGAVTRGGSVTMVYVDDVASPSTPPSVATEVDASVPVTLRPATASRPPFTALGLGSAFPWRLPASPSA
jgi:hypothetical protein